MARRNGISWIKWLIILLLVGGAGYGGWRWYGKRAREESITYKSVVVSRGELVQQVTANGQINAVKNVAVGARSLDS